jgi:DNA-binding transcriptional LysR family regulator
MASGSKQCIDTEQINKSLRKTWTIVRIEIMDHLQQMRAFAAVADVGSFVGAADALDLSKPVVTRLIAALEKRLGVRLLQRTTRRVSVTDEGRLFHARCRALLVEIDEAEAEITSRSGVATGLLRVNAPVSFGMKYLANLWPAFLAKHPQVTLEVTLSDRFVDLVDEGVDVAVRIARLPSSSLISRPLASTRLVLCASPRYLRRHGTPKHPRDLARHKVLAYTLLTSGNVWDLAGPEGTVSVQVNPCLRSNSGDTCVAAALAHHGIMLQPTFLVNDGLSSGELVELLPQFRAATLGIHAVYPSRQHVAPKVRLLVDHLSQGLRQVSWPA